MQPDVAVLGGGVGGLSAAHELAARGFAVTVYEADERPGGKARSFAVPGTGDPGLPGEHGFRFFPGYYRHVTDTMARIPDADGAGTVADHLVPTEQTLIAAVHGESHLASTETPSTPREWFRALMPGRESELPPDEAAFFAERLLELLTSCERRREAELDERTWWEFLDADRRSPAFRRLAAGTQSLVALRPDRASARTVGRIYLQLLRGTLDPTLDAERVLDGPTSEVWIDPWVAHLRSLGVEFVLDAPVTAIHVEGGGGGSGTGGGAVEEGADVAGVTVEVDGSPEQVTADHYVAAVPVEAMVDLLDGDLRRAAPELAGVEELETAWMNGVQFYLREDVPLAAGHGIYVDSPWALTAVSQAQFWELDLSERHDEVGGVLSVIVSDWETPGLDGAPARECTAEEIAGEVWAQLRAHLEDDDAVEGTLPGGDLEEAVVEWFLDPAIDADGGRVENDAPLLVNTVGSLKHRPPADVAAGNLALAADYVRTDSDLASMEAANEAARRAVAGVLDAADSDAARPRLWELREPAAFEPLKAKDRLRYRLGLPHPGGVSRRVRGRLERALR